MAQAVRTNEGTALEPIVDYLVIGSGPAGLCCGYFFNQSKVSYVILEKGNSPATFFQKFPIHRRLNSVNRVHSGANNEEFALRYDWNSLPGELKFKTFDKDFFPSADSMVEYLDTY